MSSPTNPTGGPVQKQGTNVYTVMLILSFLFLTIGTIMLWMELSRFGDYPWWKTG